MLSQASVLGRVCAAVLAGAGLGAIAAGALLAAGVSGWYGELTGPPAYGGWTDRSRAWFTSRGFHSAQTDDAGHTPSWTGQGVRLVVPNLDRSQAHVLTLTLAAGRPPGVPRPTLSWSVDGFAGGPVVVTDAFTDVAIEIPARSSPRTVIILRVSDVFDPGPNDDRQLGVLVRSLTLTPASGGFRPSWTAVGSVALAVAAAVAGVLLCGITGLLAVAASVGISVASLWLVFQDGAFLGSFPDALLRIGLTAGALGLLVTLVRGRSTTAAVPPWAVAVGLTLAATLVKTAVFSHPLMMVGDGVFQVHRAQMVLGGQYFFTSITPRPFFEFPYAIGLYVAATPFWAWFPGDLGHVWLLRSVSLAADVALGLALFVVVGRAWPSSPAALYVAGLWPFARAPLEALSNANLTNAFAQSLFGVAMAGLAWFAVGGRRAPLVVPLSGAMLTAAFLSHFSTLSVGVPLVFVVAAMLVAGGRQSVRWKGLGLAAVCVVAIAASYAAYYRHFHPVYEQTVARVMARETDDSRGSSIAASPAVKLRRWATGGSDDYGLPGVPLGLLAAAGLVLLLREKRREPLTLVLAGWLGIWIGFTLLGILTSIQMRVNLAAAPVFVCLGAYALARAATGSPVLRVSAALCAALVVVDGIRLWLMCLGR